MVVSLTYKQVLRIISFPVYALYSDNFYVRDGLVLLNERVIDDRNQSGDTLGKRRLQTPHKLVRLSKAYEEFFDIILENSPRYIDSKGGIFSYDKTEWHTVKSVRVKRREVLETHTRLWCWGINFPFILRKPHQGKGWAEILYLKGRPWKLYGLSEERQADKRRKI